MDEDIVAILMMGLVMMTLVGGIMIRVALKPLVESIATLMDLRTKGANAEFLERRVALLEQEVQDLRLERLKSQEEREFMAQLGRGKQEG